MRPIYLAELAGRTRPVVILTREASRSSMTKVTVAPITSRVRGLHVEVPVGPANGIDHDSVINCDNLITIDVSALRRPVGMLLDAQEQALAQAIAHAFDLDL